VISNDVIDSYQQIYVIAHIICNNPVYYKLHTLRHFRMIGQSVPVLTLREVLPNLGRGTGYPVGKMSQFYSVPQR
jgi:hypothetical protein